MKNKLKKWTAVLLTALMLFGVATAAPVSVSAAEATQDPVGASSGATGDCTWTLDDNGVLTISGNGAMGNYYSSSSMPWGTSIKSAIIENGVTSISNYAFYDCTGLTGVTIPDSVTSIGNCAFYRCTGLTGVTIPDSVTRIGYEVFLQTAWYNNQPDGLVYAGKVAYRYKGKMPENTSIEIKNGTKQIADSAFSGCTGLTSVTIPDSVSSIGNSAFNNTTWYNNQPDGLVYAGKVAYKYKGTMPANTSIILQDGTKGIADSAFYNCTDLTSIIIPDSVTSIGDYAFGGCTGLTSVAIPDSVTSIGDSAFEGCAGLTSVTIPDSVTSIGNYAFSNCKSLTSVTIPDSVTSIGKGAFDYCIGLTNITIPESVTSIGEYAFYWCKGLTSVTIPDNVTCIGEGAFEDCPDLVIFGNINSEAQKYAIRNTIPFYLIGEIPPTVEPTEPLTTVPFNADGTLTVNAVSNIFSPSCATFSATEDIITLSWWITNRYSDVGPVSGVITFDNAKLTTNRKMNQYYDASRNRYYDAIFRTGNGIGSMSYYNIDLSEFPDDGNTSGIRFLIDNRVDMGDNDTEFVSVTFKRQNDAVGETTVHLYIENMYYSICDSGLMQIVKDMQLLPEADYVCFDTSHAAAIYAGEFDPNHPDVYGEQTIPIPTYEPTYEPTYAPTEAPTEEPTVEPTTEPPWLEIYGVSNYSPSTMETTYKWWSGHDTATIVFTATESLDITDFNFGMSYDASKLELISQSFFTQAMIVSADATDYNLIGTVTNQNKPFHVSKGQTLASFTVKQLGYGSTTIDFRVIEMGIRTEYDDQARVSNGILRDVCFHESVEIEKGSPATCTNDGLTDYVFCNDCHRVLCERTTIPATGHTEVKDEAKAPTCTETGLTEGSHCSVCGEVFQAQEDIPALGHKPVIDPYLAPTCQHEGHTMGSHCERCGEIYVATSVIDKVPHTVVTDEAVAPTCGKTGLTEGSHCSVCGEILKTQKVVPALNHEYEMVPAVPATYTKEGSTDGVRCKLCGEWLIEPQIIPKKEIDFTFGDTNNDGKIDIRDVTAIQRHLADLEILTDKQLGAADVNFDGVVDINDATHLQKYLAEYDGIVLGKQS